MDTLFLNMSPLQTDSMIIGKMSFQSVSSILYTIVFQVLTIVSPLSI